MEEELQLCLHNFDLREALVLTDKMHEIDSQRDLTNAEDALWEQLTVKIEQARGNTMFKTI